MRGPNYNVSTGILEAWFREFDEDKSGTISKDEMVNFIKKVGKFGKHPSLKLIIGDGEKTKILKEFDRPTSAFLRKR
jgi:Ca2+-binding EF-hand superfamily protein